MVKVFTLNKNGKIEISEKDLKKLLDDVYWEGYRDNSNTWTYTTPKTYPYWYSTTTPYVTTTCTSGTATINGADSSYTVSASNVKNGTVTIGKE